MSESNNELVQVSNDEGVCTITFNRPHKKNALTPAMYEVITAALLGAQDDKKTRVVLFTGEGGSFTAGNDLADFANSPPTSRDTPVFRFLQAIESAQKPLMAAVDGVAVGVGTTLLLHCDLAYASTNAVFRLPFVNLGLCPEAASSFLLPRILGHVKAAELLLLGEKFGPDKALEAGLINAVLPPEELMALVRDRATALAAKPPAAVRLSKRLMKSATQARVKEIMLEEGNAFMECLSSPEAAEAFKAFFERRAPDFSQFG